MSNIRDEVEAAFNKVADESPEGIEVDPPEPATVETTEPVEASAEVEEVETEGTETPETDAAAPEQKPEATPAPEADAPPVGWKAEEKAAWNKVPPELKAAIHRREKEAAQLASRFGQGQKMVEAINQVVSPHIPMLKKLGKDPVAVMDESLQLAHMLNTGTPADKVEAFGKMLNHFNVDLAALDAYLVDPKNAPASRQPAQQQPAYDPKKDPALAPLFTIAQQVEQRQQEAVSREVEEAAKWPKFEEVRTEMADLLEWEENRGNKLTIGQAYTRITGLQPPPKAVAPPPPPPKNVSQAAAILARSRKAASSVAGNKKAAPVVDTDDIRATVVAAANGML